MIIEGRHKTKDLVTAMDVLYKLGEDVKEEMGETPTDVLADLYNSLELSYAFINSILKHDKDIKEENDSVG